MPNITKENIPATLKAIAEDGCCILATNRGQGCNGAFIIDHDEILTTADIVIDEVVQIDGTIEPGTEMADVISEMSLMLEALKLGELGDYEAIGVRKGETFREYYLLWTV